MKTKLIILIAALAISCSKGENEQKTSEWVKNSPKPIQCLWTTGDGFGNSHYTLINANGEIYVTGSVKMRLPKTISN